MLALMAKAGYQAQLAARNGGNIGGNVVKISGWLMKTASVAAQNSGGMAQRNIES
jgi:hypothetical protein